MGDNNMFSPEAIVEANAIDEKIKQVLCNGENFRVDAGAGSGKTFSLMKVIEWLQDNKANEYRRTGKKVACLTFTNAAVDVILSRLDENSFIQPMTIHSFAWSVIKQFQNKILELMDTENLLPEDVKMEEIIDIQYSLGIKYFNTDEHTLYLGHNDILKLFASFLDNQKFRSVLSNIYPIVLIDEYQDSNKNVVDKFIEYYISQNKGIQFGFFGDSWQTIYQTNGACGFIDHQNITSIKKTINFRSSQVIVDVLNKIRPDMPQKSALTEQMGSVKIITCDDFSRTRRNDRAFTGDLPVSELEKRVDTLKSIYIERQAETESLKVLMLTHRLLAEQQGYYNLFTLLGDGLKNADDALLSFFINTIDPLIEAINNNDILAICDVLGVKRFPIKKKKDKRRWSSLKNSFIGINNKSIFEILSILKNSEVLPFPTEISAIYEKMQENSKENYQKGTYSELKNVTYKEFQNAKNFLRPDSLYSTEHGVKGEEYDSVIFVVSKGWYLYQFDKYMPLQSNLLDDKERKSYEQNRNLFYVCCSRARRNLVLFVTFKLESPFKEYLECLVGQENIVSYDEFVRTQVV